MEKLPLGKRPEPKVVGRVSEEAKEKAREIYRSQFGEGHIAQFPEKRRELLKSAERPETVEEKEAIRVANEITNELLVQFGLKPFDIPEKNVHFIGAEKDWKELLDDKGNYMVTAYVYQGVFVNCERKGEYGDGAELFAASALFHEFCHLKGHVALDAYSEKSRFIKYRGGLNVLTGYKKPGNSGGVLMFRGLHEAVVSQLQKEYAGEIFGRNRFLGKTAAKLESEEAGESKEKLAAKYGILAEEIFWVSNDGGEFRFYPYLEQRKLLNYVVEKIYEDGGFASRDEVMRLFFKAQFTGNLLEIGRLVEKSFGKGAFRVLGSMPEVPDASAEVTKKKLLFRREEKILKEEKS